MNMKEFDEAKLQIVALDLETEEKYTLSLGNLIEDADVTAIQAIGEGFNQLIDSEVTHAKVVETHIVSL